MSSIGFFCFALALISCWDLADTCGNVQQQPAVTEVEVDFGTLIKYSQDPKVPQRLFETIDKIVNALNIELPSAEAIRRDHFENDGNLALRFIIEAADCHEMAKFGEAVKDTVSFISSANIQCDGEETQL
ncbi:unnamed protein product [Caenorhabditis bovis]|uniref:Domain of unknown function WSN domain-containing protein n=1 Tax=Caenorhabditis bovis TaxID=2654633 RepID=A0A8S1EF21_9PELO|nr:unnamed protein product [Caenorhabditis bovis]CAB3398759.1 unnamed protein product [Caenorhabditis bovis]